MRTLTTREWICLVIMSFLLFVTSGVKATETHCNIDNEQFEMIVKQLAAGKEVKVIKNGRLEAKVLEMPDNTVMILSIRELPIKQGKK